MEALRMLKNRSGVISYARRVNLATEEEFNEVMMAFNAAWDKLYPGRRCLQSRSDLNYRVKKMICKIGGVDRTVRLINFAFDNWTKLKEQLPWRKDDSPYIRVILRNWKLIKQIEDESTTGKGSTL